MKQTASKTSSLRRGLILMTLIAADEVVFVLPFLLTRVFRPTFLDVFEVMYLQSDTVFSL